jgi:hypothetical protein
VSVILGSATVPSSTTVAVFSLPPGYSNFTVYQPTQAQPVYIGPGSAVTAVNGMPVPNTPLNQETYTGSAGATIYATTGNATASSFSYIICTSTN